MKFDTERSSYSLRKRQATDLLNTPPQRKQLKTETVCSNYSLRKRNQTDILNTFPQKEQLKTELDPAKVNNLKNLAKDNIPNEKCLVKCDVCAKSYSPLHISQHQRLHKLNVINSFKANIDYDKIKLDVNHYVPCEICKKQISVTYIKRHIHRHSLKMFLSDKQDADGKNFNACSTDFETAEGDNDKMVKLQRCDVCSKEVSEGYIKKHIARHFFDQTCKICKRKFSEIGIQRHNCQPKYQCSQCDQKFYYRSKLESHYRMHAVDEKRKSLVGVQFYKLKMMNIENICFL